jgi:hypothetical protein
MTTTPLMSHALRRNLCRLSCHSSSPNNASFSTLLFPSPNKGIIRWYPTTLRSIQSLLPREDFENWVAGRRGNVQEALAVTRLARDGKTQGARSTASSSQYGTACLTNVLYLGAILAPETYNSDLQCTAHSVRSKAISTSTPAAELAEECLRLVLDACSSNLATHLSLQPDDAATFLVLFGWRGSSTGRACDWASPLTASARELLEQIEPYCYRCLIERAGLSSKAAVRLMVAARAAQEETSTAVNPTKDTGEEGAVGLDWSGLLSTVLQQRELWLPRYRASTLLAVVSGLSAYLIPSAVLEQRKVSELLERVADRLPATVAPDAPVAKVTSPPGHPSQVDPGNQNVMLHSADGLLVNPRTLVRLWRYLSDLIPNLNAANPSATGRLLTQIGADSNIVLRRSVVTVPDDVDYRTLWQFPELKRTALELDRLVSTCTPATGGLENLLFAVNTLRLQTVAAEGGGNLTANGSNSEAVSKGSQLHSALWRAASWISRSALWEGLALNAIPRGPRETDCSSLLLDALASFCDAVTALAQLTGKDEMVLVDFATGPALSSILLQGKGADPQFISPAHCLSYLKGCALFSGRSESNQPVVMERYLNAIDMKRFLPLFPAPILQQMVSVLEKEGEGNRMQSEGDPLRHTSEMVTMIRAALPVALAQVRADPIWW